MSILATRLEGLLVESKTKEQSGGIDCSKMSAEEIIKVIDKRAPDGEFSLDEIMTDSEVETLSRNPNLDDLKAISEVIYSAVMELIKRDESSTPDDDDEDDEEETLDAPETNESRARMTREKHKAYFDSYKRPGDVSAKIKRDDSYNIKGLISRRTKNIPVSVPFGLGDVLSTKELEAISRHATFNDLDQSTQRDVTNALDAQMEAVALEIDTAIVEAALSADKKIAPGRAALAALQCGMAVEVGGDFYLTTLGESHGLSMIDTLIEGDHLSDFSLDESAPANAPSNTPEMEESLSRIASSNARISIRPNLNSKGEVTVHKGSLGRKMASVRAVTIRCESVVVRPSGQSLAQKKGDKTVHAGFIGRVNSEVIMPDSSSPAVTYNPHKGDREFKVNGKVYEGGGLITMVGWKAYKVK
jgi:hypothetical protein